MIMRKFIAYLFLALSLGGCAGTSTSSSIVITAEQAQAGALYLESSVTTLQTALDAAKATGDQAKVTTAQAVLDKAKAAAEAFKATTTTTNWDFARSLITTAVSVAAPIAIQALVSGS
jgi:hypothetical protein